MRAIKTAEIAIQLKELGKSVGGRYIINAYDMARYMPEFVSEFKFLIKQNKQGAIENQLKKIASEIGPFSVVNGTTEYDVPRFLRDHNYIMSEEELIKRASYPGLFKVSEFLITPDKIERRLLWNQREDNIMRCFDVWTDGRQTRIIEERKYEQKPK